MSSWLVTFTEATDVAARSDLLSQWKAEGKINGVGRQFEIINTAVVEATPEQYERIAHSYFRSL